MAGEPTLDQLASFSRAEFNTQLNDDSLPASAQIVQLDQAAQITATAEKTTFTNGDDELLIEDAAAANVKKSVKLKNFPILHTAGLSVLNPSQGAVDLASATTYSLYTVPTGYDVIVMGCFICGITQAGTVPSVSLGVTASAYSDIYEDQALTGFAVGKIWSMLPGGLSQFADEADVITLKVNTGAGGATTGIPYVVGYQCASIM